MNKLNILKNLSLLLLIALVVNLTFGASKVNAGFGVSPSDIVYEHMKPGDHYEKIIVISSSDADEDLAVTVDTELGEVENWVKFVPGKEFDFNKGETRKELKVVIDVPKDAKFDEFTGTIRVKAASKKEQESGVSVVKGARVNVQLITTDLNVNNLQVRKVEFIDTEEGQPLLLSMTIENIGNVPSSPTKVQIDVTDLNNTYLETLIGGNVEKIPVGETKVVTSSFSPTVGAGEYFAKIKILLDDSVLREDTLHFRLTSKIVQPQETAQDTAIAIGLAKATDRIWSFLLSPIALMLLLIILIVLIMLFVYIIRKRKGEGAYKYITYILGISLFVTIFSVGLVVLNESNTYKVPEEFFEPVVVTTPVETQSDNNAEVKGVSTVDNSQVVSNSNDVEVLADLNVIDANRQNGFPVYRTPDPRSDVIASAQSGDTFDVWDETEGYYQILLSEGELGWIKKSDIVAKQ